MNITTIGQEYITLALHINQHLDGFVDSYFGPPELKAAVEAAGTQEISALQRRTAELQEALDAVEMTVDRRDFLVPQVWAMQTVLRRLAGEDLSLTEEVEACFDITPQRIAEAELETALGQLDSLLPGKGDISVRLEAWETQFDLPSGKIMLAMNLALTETRRRTLALFDLPKGETVELELVSDQPWSGYNWYLGNYKSLVQTNTDLPVRAHNLPGLMAHEGYPGHHTEHVLKEEALVKKANRLEHRIFLLLAPESTVAEAIATVAEDIIFPTEADLADWLANEYYPALGITVDVSQQLGLQQAREKLAGVGGNAAFYLHVDGWADKKVVDYFRHYGSSEKRARQRLRFIGNPTFRAYIFNYFYGKKILKRACEVGDAVEVFRWALTEPVTPSAIAARGIVS